MITILEILRLIATGILLLAQLGLLFLLFTTMLCYSRVIEGKPSNKYCLSCCLKRKFYKKGEE